jgi:hypothetical protein
LAPQLAPEHKQLIADEGGKRERDAPVEQQQHRIVLGEQRRARTRRGEQKQRDRAEADAKHQEVLGSTARVRGIDGS